MSVSLIWKHRSISNYFIGVIFSDLFTFQVTINKLSRNFIQLFALISDEKFLKCNVTYHVKQQLCCLVELFRIDIHLSSKSESPNSSAKRHQHCFQRYAFATSANIHKCFRLFIASTSLRNTRQQVFQVVYIISFHRIQRYATPNYFYLSSFALLPETPFWSRQHWKPTHNWQQINHPNDVISKRCRYLASNTYRVFNFPSEICGWNMSWDEINGFTSWEKMFLLFRLHLRLHSSIVIAARLAVAF